MWRSPPASRGLELRDLDFLALILSLGLLYAAFRHSERWLHQHLFKLGWLLTNSFDITGVLHYIVFLPGIALRELSLVLAAALLRAPMTIAFSMPGRQEQGELRQNFVRVAPSAGKLKLSLIALAPIAAGVLALWAIAAGVFDWRATAVLLAPGTLDALAAAVASLRRTPYLWLWLYLAFTIANTMFPPPPLQLSARRKTVLFTCLALGSLVAWRFGGEIDQSIAAALESILGGLTLTLLQVAAINGLAVLALGTAEALIERATGRSAAFRDGVMLTMTRAEAIAQRQSERQSEAAQRQERATTKQPKPARSIYEFKLPIPGPPGREPISRRAAAVVDAPQEPKPKPSPDRPVPEPNLEAPPPSPVIPTARNVRRRPETTPGPELPQPAFIESSDGETAPFSRPFRPAGNPAPPEDSAPLDRPDPGQFARPFALPTRATELTPQAHENAPQEKSPSASRTRPAPKPSKKAKPNAKSPADEESTELVYEPLEDDDVYVDEDELP